MKRASLERWSGSALRGRLAMAAAVAMLSSGIAGCVVLFGPPGSPSPSPTASPSPSPSPGPSPSPSPSPSPTPAPALALQLVHSGLDGPTDLQSPPDGTERLFILEKPGRIRISDAGMLQPANEAFLDITNKVLSAGSEQGLLGLAFHPDFAENGRFFVNYTALRNGAGVTIVAEYSVSDNPNRADTDSEQILLEIVQPFANHNAGQLQFGPDGMFYVGTGDGGLACDPNDNAQDPESLLGKMLRLDVDSPPNFVPDDNPFVGLPGARDEVWSMGLRNPWRYSFDSATGDLYIADVGQAAREEINVVTVFPGNPRNFGWPQYEGTLTPPPACGPAEAEVTAPVMPVYEYTHDEGCSITGGYVYRGEAIPSLQGRYLFADYCSVLIRALRVTNGQVADVEDLTASLTEIGGTLHSPSSFGIDADGELYILDLDGDVFKLVPGGQS